MRKNYLLCLLLISLVLFSGCFGSSKKEEEKDDKNVAVDERKNEEYINTISTYIGSIMYYINEYDVINYNSSNVLLFLPIGNKVSCADNVIESPYSSIWEYAYTAVWFDGNDYHYYVVSKDGAGYGINFVNRIDLMTNDYKQVVNSGLIEAKEYIDNYKTNLDGNKTYSIDQISSELKEVINGNFDSINTIVFIDPSMCSY